MALLPSTPPSRVVPVAGRQFAERRLMRGVGAAERAVGSAWGRMTSRQREYYGNQRNFALGLQGIANARGAAKETADREAERQRGFEDATGQSANSRAIAAKSAPPEAKTDHSSEVMPTQQELFAQRTAKRRQNDMARMKSENPDRYKRLNDSLEVDAGVARPRPNYQDKPDLDEAGAAGRVNDHSNLLTGSTRSRAEGYQASERGYDGSLERQLPDSDPAEIREFNQRTKVYQMGSRLRFAERGQKPLKTGISY